MLDFLANNSLILVVVALIVAVLPSSMKIAHENERFAVFVLGRFAGFKGPGLIFKSSTSKFIRLKIGDIGTLTRREFARFGENDIPIKNTADLRVGDSVRIERFDETGLHLVKSSVPPRTHCPKCGHEF